MNIREAIAVLARGDALSGDLARAVAVEIFEGAASPAQIGAFLTALRMRGERAEHIRAFAETMRDKSLPVRAPEGVVLDTCGTGGDGSGTFNISTAAAIIASAGGAVVAKHGNRAASSACGSADVLEALGVKIDLEPAAAERCLREVGITFLFAQRHHGAMKHAGGPRKEIGIRTIFNLLGPLSNPARATHQLIGVFDAALLRPYCEALRALGTKRALVAHGDGGLDELTTAGASRFCELKDGDIREGAISPQELGLGLARIEDLRGADAATNRDILLAIFKGTATAAQRDTALLNGGAALYVAERAATIRDGVEMAREVLDSGAAMRKLEAWVECSNRA